MLRPSVVIPQFGIVPAGSGFPGIGVGAWAKFRQISATRAHFDMKFTAAGLILLSFCGTVLAHAQISSFQHVIVIVQENRSPDNLFQGLCTAPFGNSSSCSTSPTGSQYDIQTSKWLDKTSSTGTTNPTTVALDNVYDPDHTHLGFTNMCDLDTKTGACRMDGGADNSCTGTCPKRPPVPLCKQFELDLESLPDTRNLVRLGKLYVPDQSGPQFSRPLISLRRNFGPQRGRRCYRYIQRGEHDPVLHDCCRMPCSGRRYC